MNNKSDVFTRRILTSPAIFPCESVSPVTLLNSLIKLSHTICDYKSRLFISNKRNASKSIRLIGNLLFFFEEIRSRQSELSSSFVLCLSELHFTFQKVQYLIEDSTRHDARLWMLMNSKSVSNQFGVLIRSIAVALDVLELDSIDVSIEVKELVDFVKKQALKSTFEVELEDKRASERVLRILRRFEEEIVPEPRDLKWVLEYLGIQKWSECNREFKFLEAEIELERSTTKKRDMELLSSLMGFMKYCGCVLFDFVDCLGTHQTDGGSSNEVIRCLNSDDFRCPISLEIMTDPVTISTGQTYDRLSILKWFKAGNPTCPKTGEKLTCKDLVPNLALKQLTKHYCSENGIPFSEPGGCNCDITRTVLAGSLAAEQAMKMAADFLVCSLVAGTREEQNKATFEIRVLTKTSIFNRSCLMESGAIPYLLNLLSSTDSVVQENSIAALLNLSKHSKGKRVMVENGGLELILGVLKEGLKMEARQHAAGTLFYLASIEEYRVMIGESPEAIPSLKQLFKDGTARGKKNALVAIFGLLKNRDNHQRVLATGLVPLLVDLVRSSQREDLITDNLAVLTTLAEKFDGTMAIFQAGGLPVIVPVLSSSTSRITKEYCVSLLLALCFNGGADVILLLVKNTSLMGPLYSLITEGTSRASKKASSLIKILHEFNEKSSFSLISPALPHERFIHV